MHLMPSLRSSSSMTGPPQPQALRSKVQKLIVPATDKPATDKPATDRPTTDSYSGDAELDLALHHLDLTDCDQDGKRDPERYGTTQEVLQVAGRIKYLTLPVHPGFQVPHGFDPLYESRRSLGFAKPLTKLEGLCVAVPQRSLKLEHPAFDLDKFLATLAGIATLRQLEIEFGRTRAPIESPHRAALFHNLSHIKLRAPMTANQCVRLITSCGQAVEFNLELRMPLSDMPDPPPQHNKVKLPNLRWLKLSFRKAIDTVVIGHIDCPNLENLFIRNELYPDPCSTGRSPAEILDALAVFLASCEQLKQLVLVVECFWEELETANLPLKCMEAIREVEIRVRAPYYNPFDGPESLKSLIRKQLKSYCTGSEALRNLTCTFNASTCHMSHIGWTSRENQHIGVPLQPIDSDWKLAFWNTDDKLECLMWPWR